MFRQREMVRNGTRFEKQRLPLLLFLLQVNYFRKDISFVKDSLISIHSAINIEVNCFDLCSSLFDSVREMSTLVEKFYGFLEKSLHLPPVVVPLRYQLIITLHHSDKLASELMSLITSFRSLSQTPSAQVTTLLQEIQRRHNLLIQNSQEILEDIDLLRHQVVVPPWDWTPYKVKTSVYTINNQGVQHDTTPEIYSGVQSASRP